MSNPWVVEDGMPEECLSAPSTDTEALEIIADSAWPSLDDVHLDAEPSISDAQPVVIPLSEDFEVVEPPKPTGPVAPQNGVPIIKGEGLKTMNRPSHAAVWVVGCHGGAGETTLASLDPRWLEGEHCWPKCQQPAKVVLVSRTGIADIKAARSAIKQWAGGVTPHIELFGIIFVADAPGKLPKPIKDFMRVVSGGAPRSWFVPFVKDWRLINPDISNAPRAIRRVVSEINALASFDER